jgi:hypothetical protein
VPLPFVGTGIFDFGFRVPSFRLAKVRDEKRVLAAAADPLSAEELRKMHAYWRAANYLSVGQIYLMDNPLLKEPLALKHIKPRLLGRPLTPVCEITG